MKVRRGKALPAGGGDLADTEASGGSPDLRQQLLAIRQNPQAKRVALRLMDGDPELAEDIIQAAIQGIAAHKHPDRIGNLRAYFFQVLRNEAHKLYRLQRETPHEEPELSVDQARLELALCGLVPDRAVDEAVCFAVLAESWLKRFTGQREHLLAMVPGRSADPARYCRVIYEAAAQVLRDGINSEPSDADSNDALRTAYPEYFDQPGAAANTLDKRRSRAREEVRALLQEIVDRDELF